MTRDIEQQVKKTPPSLKDEQYGGSLSDRSFGAQSMGSLFKEEESSIAGGEARARDKLVQSGPLALDMKKGIQWMHNAIGVKHFGKKGVRR